MKIFNISFLIIFFLFHIIGFSQSDNDSIRKYAEYLQEIENGNLEINYQNFRISYIKSKEFSEKGNSNYYELKQEVYKNISKNNYTKVISLCTEMIKIDYTSMFAHKYLQQSAKLVDSTYLQKKHHDIEFGLLKSIIHNGDGKSCETSWEVTQVEEEYFILDMLGAKLKKQSLIGECDKMMVKVKRKKRTYYFGVFYVFQGYKFTEN